MPYFYSTGCFSSHNLNGFLHNGFGIFFYMPGYAYMHYFHFRYHSRHQVRTNSVYSTLYLVYCQLEYGIATYELVPDASETLTFHLRAIEQWIRTPEYIRVSNTSTTSSWTSFERFRQGLLTFPMIIHGEMVGVLRQPTQSWPQLGAKTNKTGQKRGCAALDPRTMSFLPTNNNQ